MKAPGSERVKKQKFSDLFFLHNVMKITACVKSKHSHWCLTLSCTIVRIHKIGRGLQKNGQLTFA